MQWKGMTDVASVGRNFSKGVQAGIGQTTRRLMAMATGLGWEFAKDEPVGFRFFNKSAHAVYRTKGFMFSMRGSTRSVHGLETHVMGMNPKGGHLTDGSLFTSVTGNEYRDIFPLWNWRMLPGLTSYTDLPPVRRSFQDEYNVSPNELEEMEGFSEGEGGRLHYAFRREGLSFVNDYVFTPTGLTVTVSNVTSARTNTRVSTCIEQAWACENARIQPWAEGCVTAVNGGITYRVYGPKDAIHGEIAERTGDWRTVNTERPSVPCSGKVFQLWIDYGKAPQGASVRYMIIP